MKVLYRYKKVLECQENKPFNKPAWQPIALYTLMLTGLLILATRALTVLHEVLGHAFTAFFLGGKVFKIQISLFGGGRVWAHINNDHLAVRFLFSLSGIFINLLTGALAVFLLKKIPRVDIRWRLFLALFALASLIGSIGYLVMGIYYQFGDPVNWIEQIPKWFELCWVPLFLSTPFIAFYCTRVYLAAQECVFPTNNFINRFKITTVTLGMALLAYSALFFSTNQSVALGQAPAAAYHREEAIILKNLKQELFAKLREQYPTMTREEIENLVEKTPVAVDPDQVPVKFPIIPLFVFLCLTGGVLSLFQKPGFAVDPSFRPAAGDVVLICLAAVVVIMILVYTGGIIYKVHLS